MSDGVIYAQRKIAPTRLSSSSDGYNPVTASLDGGLHAMDWRAARVWAGEVFHVTVGAFSTPITGGGAGTILDADQPEFLISVPVNKTIIPIRVHIQTLQPLLATDADEVEILLAVDRLSAGSAGTSTAATVFNARTDNIRASACTAYTAYTGNMTAAPTLGIELARSINTGDVNGTPGFAAFNTKHELLYEPDAPPLIVGPASLVGYWGGTVATTGFAQIQWVEIDTPPTS